MSEQSHSISQVDQFVIDQIDSVPHLEALLLLWNRRPRQWSLEEMAKALYISLEATEAILYDLKQRGLVTGEDAGYSYDPASRHDRLMAEVDRTYRHELVRISRMIHSKASPSVREFARAFKFKKD